MENFSPFAFNAHIEALIPDGPGGLWFGLGQTLEHIGGTGAMQSYVVSPEWLWRVWSLARDPSHGLWFSLGQSGRIGTIDATGGIHTKILVPRRYFPDIRQIAFAPGGTLWFLDLGRRSIGRRTPHGSVEEIPLPTDSYPVDFTFCNGRPWVAVRTSIRSRRQAIGIFVASSQLRELHAFYPFRENGQLSLGCDDRRNVWFAFYAYGFAGTSLSPPLTGFIDRKNRIRQFESTIRNQHIAGTGDGAWVIGTTSAPNAWPWKTTLEHRQGERLVSTWTLPVSCCPARLTVSPDGTIWMSLYNPYSIVRLRSNP